MNDFSINTIVPVTRYSNMVTFRDINRSSKLDGDVLKRMTNFIFNVDHFNPQYRIIIYEFGKEMKFDIKQKGRSSNRDKYIIKLHESPSIIGSGLSTVFSPSDPNELCDRLKLLLQEEHTGNSS